MSWAPKDKVLVPIDFSEFCINALSVARDLVTDVKGLHVVHVIAIPGVPAPTLVAAGEQSSDEANANDAEARLKGILRDRDLADAQAVVVLDEKTYRYSVGVTIAKYARDIGAELIVIPTHGATGLRRLMIGSTAHQVLRHAECPVLLLPHPA